MHAFAVVAYVDIVAPIGKGIFFELPPLPIAREDRLEFVRVVKFCTRNTNLHR